MSDVVVIRASSLSGYADCPRRSAARMFAAEIEAAGFALRKLRPVAGAAVGSAVHKAASVMLEEKARAGELPPRSVSDDAAMAELRDKMQDELTWDKETPSVTAAEVQVRRMADVYRRDIAPCIRPVLVEKRLEAQVSPLIVLSGQADVIAHEADSGRVRDLKTGKTCGNHAPQIGGYSLLARTPTEDRPGGVDIREAAIDWVPRVSVNKEQPPARIIVSDVARAETAALAVLRHIESDLLTWRQGDPSTGVLPGDPWAWMANPSSMLCSEKFCPAYGTNFCREHKAKEN